MPRREGDFTMDLKEMSVNTKNRIDSGQGGDYWRALINAGLNFRVPWAVTLIN